jgi:hypothetical protein
LIKRETVGCGLSHSWYRRGKRVKPPFWDYSKQGIKLPGTVTDGRGLLAIEVVDRFISELTILFLRALQDEFGENIHVLLDNASCFTPQQVHDFIEATEIEVTYVP